MLDIKLLQVDRASAKVSLSPGKLSLEVLGPAPEGFNGDDVVDGDYKEV